MAQLWASRGRGKSKRRGKLRAARRLRLQVGEIEEEMEWWEGKDKADQETCDLKEKLSSLEVGGKTNPENKLSKR